jgi:transcriptional regulator GlxA family with amidase domain
MLWSSKPINAKAFDYFPALRKIHKYFETHYSEPISLKKAASIAGLEEKYFSKMFHSHVGVGFKEWTDLIRVQKAMDAIQTEEQSLTTVGFAVGFQSSATFRRLFKKHARMRPRDFKRAVVSELGGTERLSFRFFGFGFKSAAFRRRRKITKTARKKHES